MKKIIQFKPNDNAEDVKMALLIVYQGYNTIQNFIDDKGMCFMVADIDTSVEDDLKKFGYKVIDMPKSKDRL